MHIFQYVVWETKRKDNFEERVNGPNLVFNGRTGSTSHRSIRSHANGGQIEKLLELLLGRKALFPFHLKGWCNYFTWVCSGFIFLSRIHRHIIFTACKSYQPYPPTWVCKHYSCRRKVLFNVLFTLFWNFLLSNFIFSTNI
jgi:hypothetical protein